jgi:type II secretory pathway pseudopilin PulG
MKQLVGVMILVSILVSNTSVYGKWIPENATVEDVKRLVEIEKITKRKILQHELEQKRQQQVVSRKPISEAYDIPRNIPEHLRTKEYVLTKVKHPSGSEPREMIKKSQNIIQQVSKKEETKQTEKILLHKRIQRLTLQDKIIVSLCLLIAIFSLIFYFYSLRRLKLKYSKRPNIKDKKQKGATLVELLVATVIITITTLCILRIFQQAIMTTPKTAHSTIAINKCQEKLEELRSMDFDELVRKANNKPIEEEKINIGTCGWDGDTPINGGAIRTILIEKIDEVDEGDEIKIVSTTSDNFDYLKLTVEVRWGVIPLRKQLSTFVARR